MTFRQFLSSWWGWLLLVAIAATLGVVRHWDLLSLYCAGVLLLTGIVRWFSKQVHGFLLRGLTRYIRRLPPEKQERELLRLSQPQREEILRELGR